MPLMRRTRGVITPAVLEEPQFRTYKHELCAADRLTFVSGNTALMHNRGFPTLMLSMATLEAVPFQVTGAASQGPTLEVSHALQLGL